MDLCLEDMLLCLWNFEKMVTVSKVIKRKNKLVTDGGRHRLFPVSASMSRHALECGPLYAFSVRVKPCFELLPLLPFETVKETPQTKIWRRMFLIFCEQWLGNFGIKFGRRWWRHLNLTYLYDTYDCTSRLLLYASVNNGRYCRPLCRRFTNHHFRSRSTINKGQQFFLPYPSEDDSQNDHWIG